MKVFIILGTRPEAIKLAPVIIALKKSSLFDTQVILTGQHKEMVTQVMNLFQLSANYDLEIMQHKQTLTDITCKSLQGLESIFQQEKPNLILVQGDTTTAFASTLAAFYQQIPIGHVEAGLRTDDLFNPYPEEANRRLISQLAKLHFAPTEQSVINLKNSGVIGHIYQTGNTVIDALLTVAKNKPDCHISGLDWAKYKVILTTVHRRENWGEPLKNIAFGLLKIVDKFPETALILPLHRNPIVREPLTEILGKHPRIFLTEPLDYKELVGAIQRSYLILTDSGGLQEEAPSLGKPVLVLRETTERPEAIAFGTAKLVGTNSDHIAQIAGELLTNKAVYDQMANAINPFGDGQASERILEIITEFLVNRL